MPGISDINGKLDDLKAQHRMLDDKIVALESDPALNQLKIQRMKRQKLNLRDEISRLRTILLPDIIAWTRAYFYLYPCLNIDTFPYNFNDASRYHASLYEAKSDL